MTTPFSNNVTQGVITTQNVTPTVTATPNSTVVIKADGYSTASVAVSGTYTGALSCLVSLDGIAWFTLAGTPFTNVSGTSSTTIPSASQGLYYITLPGAYSFIAVSGLSAMTGSANVVICLTAGVTPLVNAVVAPSSTVTAYYGQKAVAVAGTAVQLSATSYILQNGLIVTSLSSNTSTGLTIGNSGVINALTGSGNGTVLYPGGSISIGAGVNLNSIYINSTALDIITYAGS